MKIKKFIFKHRKQCNIISPISLGAGSGIGRAACNILVRDGATIIAVDRNEASAAATIKSLGNCMLKSVSFIASKK